VHNICDPEVSPNLISNSTAITRGGRPELSGCRPDDVWISGDWNQCQTATKPSLAASSSVDSNSNCLTSYLLESRN